MAVSLSLSMDLGPWKKGVRDASGLVEKGLNRKTLAPFDKAVKKSIAGMKAGFVTIGAFIKTTLIAALGPLALIGAAIAAVTIAYTMTKKILTESLVLFREYSDSVTVLRASLASIGTADIPAAIKGVEELAAQLRLAMGIIASDTNATFASFITRGFDVEQSKQLTILAANYATAFNKPLADVAKKIADAANGSLGAMKDLNVEIAATGNAVTDGTAAVLKLKSTYGDIGTTLTNPSQQLTAAWNNLGVILGARIAPLLEPLIQNFSDLITGMGESKEILYVFDLIAKVLAFFIQSQLGLIKIIAIIIESAALLRSVIKNFLTSIFNEAMKQFTAFLDWLPGGSELMDKMGLGGMTSDLFSRRAQESAEAMKAASDDLVRLQSEFLSGDTGAGLIGRTIESAVEKRKSAVDSLDKETASNKDVGFAGKPAHDKENAKAAEEEKKAEGVVDRDKAAREKARADSERAREKALENKRKREARANLGNVTGHARGLSSGMTLRVFNTEPDRYRRARSR